MDKNNQIPELELVLETDMSEPAAPVLILGDTEESSAGDKAPEENTAGRDLASVANAVKPDTSALTEQEKAQISEFAKKIDIANATQILQYGVSAQKKISSFSEVALSNVRTKDMSEVGDMITSLVGELRGFSADPGEKKGPFAFFRKTGSQIAGMKTKYDSVEKNVDRICDALEGHKVVLMKDVAMLDQMYELNLTYYKELTMYILAGRERLEAIIAGELPALQKKAELSNSPEDAQAANYLADMCNRFDKKLHDLELTRMVSIQMGPQIRLVQSTNSIMIEKIQSSLVNTIPLWKNQMVLALGMAHSQSAIKAQREVTDITNQLLKKNADTLKTNTIEAARESERSIVDIETLQHTNQALISTLDEVLQIQQEGRQKRREAEKELGRIETELKGKLLEIRDKTN
ncbi:MAG: toxic anion resistance protein [Oscillospiraceae bacterium]|jgi:uncharacterized protein YaaN involved in tellurite resistance|nr:toxic anion resistance protein [Oscillospiraceae bacterium]